MSIDRFHETAVRLLRRLTPGVKITDETLATMNPSDCFVVGALGDDKHTIFKVSWNPVEGVFTGLEYLPEMYKDKVLFTQVYKYEG